MKNTVKKLIAITGPTASGKTDISLRLAKQVGGEIISADSRLVYRDFNIGTAKPNAEELSRASHYLIDVVSPTEDFTVEKYVRQAETAIQEISSRGNIPIICGGTGFYIKALIEGLNIPDVTPDVEYREELRIISETEGRERLHEILSKSDPDMATKLHPNDSFRIIRALEVQKHLGEPMSKVQTKGDDKYDVLYIGLNASDREYLYERINRRVHIMMQDGMIEEVENLIKKYGRTVSLLKTLGYREICEYFDEILTYDEMIEKIQKNSRNYAKRQLTWFRANKNINWFFIDKMNSEEICEEVVKKYHD
ncbi:MAG: tRNA (adenosine(37)-N6)-dimethylallyltransferase MiaA [bacterium]